LQNTPTGGLAIAQIEEKNKKSSTFTCPNPVCGKVFTKPLKALNLQRDDEGPYDACPYCLTEITVEEEPAINFDEPETLEQETLEPETLGSKSFEPEPFEPFEAETFEAEEASVEAEPEVEEAEAVEEKTEGSSECAHYLGYLSEKSSKDQIPDECMMCKDIVSCMLKKMKT
jgi:hypothetical protein